MTPLSEFESTSHSMFTANHYKGKANSSFNYTPYVAVFFTLATVQQLL